MINASNSSKNSYIYGMRKAIAYLENLPIDPNDNAVWDVLHQVIWHKGVDRVRWINENKELIERIIPFEHLYQMPENLFDEVVTSIRALKLLDR